MPRFYLNLLNGGGLIEDQEGQEYDGLAEARASAIRGLRDVLAGELLVGELNTASRIEIEDGNRRQVAVVAFEDAVRITTEIVT